MEQYSVLMTMYKKDNAEYARQSINSMLNQTVKTDDFVIVCDGPLTNELNELLEYYVSTQGDVIRIFRFEKNEGLGSALRFGVLQCKNDLIARMDDDDISRENRCEKELLMFGNDDELSICGSFMSEFADSPEKTLRIKSVPTKPEEILKFSRRRNPFNHSTVMFRKKCILSVGNYSSMRTNQDVDLWVRVLNNGYKGVNIAETLVDFRFDDKTYARRKDWSNVKLLLKVWNEFYRCKYCTFLDLGYVYMVQVVMFLFPKRIIRWCYDHLR